MEWLTIVAISGDYILAPLKSFDILALYKFDYYYYYSGAETIVIVQGRCFGGDYSRRCGRGSGATENAGVENAIRAKMQGWKMQE